VWVSGLRVVGVLWVFVASRVFLLLALVRFFPLYIAGLPRGALHILYKKKKKKKTAVMSEM
jgi:hypothetical protein